MKHNAPKKVLFSLKVKTRTPLCCCWKSAESIWSFCHHRALTETKKERFDRKLDAKKNELLKQSGPWHDVRRLWRRDRIYIIEMLTWTWSFMSQLLECKNYWTVKLSTTLGEKKAHIMILMSNKCLFVFRHSWRLFVPERKLDSNLWKLGLIDKFS